eukprot:gene14319-15808_t
MTEEALINRFCRLDLNNLSYEQFKTDANTLLDQLLSRAHWMGVGQTSENLNEDIFHTFITYGCRVLHGRSDLLKSKFANTIYLFLVNQKKYLSEEEFTALLQFLLSSLNDCSDHLKIYFLQALGAVLYGNGANLDVPSLEMLLGSSSCLVTLLDLAKDNYGIQAEAVQCIGNICLRSKDGSLVDKSIIKMLYQSVTGYLRGLLNCQDDDNILLYKLVSRTLKVLQTITSSINYQDAIIEPDFAIALLRVYLVYGLPGCQTTIGHLLMNLPSARTAASFDSAVFTKRAKSPLIKPTTKKKRKKHASKKHLNFDEKNRDSDYTDRFSDRTDQSSGEPCHNMFSIVSNGSMASNQSSSESEFSDSESSERNRVRNACSRIRQNAIKCIQDILRCFDRKGKLSSWLLLVPETTANLEPSLLKTLSTDTSVKVRLSSLACLTELFNNSKPYLDAAVEKYQGQASSAKAFEPFSVRLRQSLVLIHDAFLQYLDRGNSDITTDKLLQCMSVLVLNTPYDKIGFELLYKMAELVPSYLMQEDLNVTITCLTCLAAIMSVKQEDEQILMLMSDQPTTLPGLCKSKPGRDGEFSSWIARYCYEQLNRSDAGSVNNERITNQCLQVFKIIVQFYPDLLSIRDREMLQLLISQKYIRSADNLIPFHAIKLMEEFGKYYAKCPNIDEGLAFWRKVLDGPLVQLFQFTSSMAKILSAVCDVFSTISQQILDALSIRYQIMCKAILLGAASDEDNSIQSAAVRALGILVTYPFVKEDTSFVIDVGRVIFQQLNSTFVGVRMKAGWALGNFTDSLIKNKSGSDNDKTNDFAVDFIVDLVSSSKQAALDHDKVKPNGVRAVGNVLRWIPKTIVGEEALRRLIPEAVDSLVQNILNGPMKEKLLTALASSLKDCKNFKVRISAAVALSTPRFRENYGNEDLFYKIWSYVIDALISSEELTDFTEFRFKGTLQNKIFLLFCHLTRLATTDDCARIQQKSKENMSLIECQAGLYANSLWQKQNDTTFSESTFESGPSCDELVDIFSRHPGAFESIRDAILKVNRTHTITSQ